jgi:hypothetical protein
MKMIETHEANESVEDAFIKHKSGDKESQNNIAIYRFMVS